MNPAVAVRVAREAPCGVAIHYPTDHFEVCHPPFVERIVTDQIAFLASSPADDRRDVCRMTR